MFWGVGARGVGVFVVLLMWSPGGKCSGWFLGAALGWGSVLLYGYLGGGVFPFIGPLVVCIYFEYGPVVCFSLGICGIWGLV